MPFLALFLAVVLVSTEHVSSLSLNTGPKNTKARIGESVTLQCDIDGLDGEHIFWYHNPSETYLTFGRDVREAVDDDRKQRYSITGSPFWYEFDLSIKNLQLLDNGYYYCGYVNGVKNVVLGSAQLTVISPPDPSSPSCSFSLLDGSGNSSPVVGSTVDLMCSWSGGQPAPTASWYRDGSSMPNNTEESFVWTRRELTSEDNGMAFSCRMESEALDAPRSCTAMPLRIPLVVVVTPSLATAEIGGSVVFTCSVPGVRRSASYGWNIPSESLPRLKNRFQFLNGRRSIRLIDIEAEDDNLVVTCSVRTNRGLLTGSGEATLRVQLPTTTPAPTTTEEPTEPPTTTASLPLTTSFNQEIQTTNKTAVFIDSGYITLYKTMNLTTRQPVARTDASPVAALPQTAVIGIGAAAALIVLVIIVVLIVYVMRYRTKSSTIRRDTSMHLVNSTYDTVLAGGRIVDNPALRNQPEYRSSFRVNTRPVATFTPRPKNQNKPSVAYAKVNKKKRQSHAEATDQQRPASPLYDVVHDDVSPEVDRVVLNLGGENPAGLTRQPTYMNQNVVRTDPDPRLFNAEGLTYAELELQNEGRLPSIKKDGTLYAKLK